MENNLVIIIAGPTASGKTGLGVELAKTINGEVVSADSMQIYKGMDIATAKPTKEEMQGIEHHLVDFVNPDSDFSVAKYKKLACEKIDEILAKGKTPIIVGGTGLYIDSVLNNTVFYDYEENDIRQKLEKEAKENGIEKLFSKLKEIDAETASRLNINDEKRIIRALEIYYQTGKTITEQNNDSHLEKPKYKFCLIGLNALNREVLYDRINKRVDIMLENGLVDEAKQFYSSSFSSTAKQAIGYKELKPYLDGQCSLSEAAENLKMATRRYAKRQLTWFRRYENINWVYIDSTDDLCGRCLEIIRQTEGEKQYGAEENYTEE